MFVDLMEKYLLELPNELHLCLSGFMVCMLPGLDDQSEAICKRVERIMLKTESIVGTRTFYGTLWLTLLRSPRTRMGGLKYISKLIPKNPEAAQETKIYSINKKIFMTDRRIIMKSASNEPVRLDEIERLKRMSLEDYDYFYYPQKGKLVINSLIECIHDNSVYVN